jgi:hypothetical protein
MKTASPRTVSPKLSRLIREIGNAILNRYEGKFSADVYEAELRDELQKIDLNNPEYRSDIARTFVRFNLAERSKVDPFATNSDGRIAPELFDQRKFERGVIRLGDQRYHVKMSDATSQQWLARMMHQQQAAEAAQHAATHTSLFLQTPPGVLLMENPRLKTAEAMSQLSLWPNDVESHDDERDDGEDLDA